MSLRQFNATYVQEEDRVLFRLTTTQGDEFRLWLTRARVREMLALGEKAAEMKVATQEETVLPQQARAVAEFRQEAAKASTQFTEFEPAAKLPLGAEPLLVRSVRMELEGALVALHLDVPAGRVLTLRLNDDMASKLRILLETISQKASWQILPNATPLIAHEGDEPVSNKTAPSGGKLLH